MLRPLFPGVEVEAFPLSPEFPFRHQVTVKIKERDGRRVLEIWKKLKSIRGYVPEQDFRVYRDNEGCWFTFLLDILDEEVRARMVVQRVLVA